MREFYTFNQNNSGGSFDFDETAGITHYVIVEAESVDDALDRASAIGLYFDGCSTGRDCSCCGDRWNAPWEDDGTEKPSIYSTPVEDEVFKHAWMPEGKEACVHYIDGRKEWYGSKGDGGE